ncbi:thioesterase domain-containing protein, partial [Corallococcus terminator]
LQARGLDGELPPFQSLQEMAALYVQAVRTVQPHGPYRLGGWSLGAVVAYEMARLLKQQGEPVEVLALIEPSPTSYARGTPFEGDVHLLSFAADLARTAGLPLVVPDTPLDTPEALLTEVQRAGLLSAGTGLEQLRALLEVFTANSRALHQHSLRAGSGPLTVILGDDSAGDEPSVGRDRGWAALAAHAVDVLTLPGDHYSLLQPPHVEALARALTSLLEQPLRRSMTG